MNKVSAFPVSAGPEDIVDPGLTKREYFAAYAMMALIGKSSGYYPEDHAKRAYEYADAMLKEGK